MGKKRVAIIDDDPSISEFLSDLLTDEGYEPVAWHRGAGAYELVKRIKPAAVLLDMNMETRDAGLHVAEAICSDPETQGIPIIIVSAEGEFLHRKYMRLRELPCRVQPKPIDIPALLALLRDVTDDVPAIH